MPLDLVLIIRLSWVGINCNPRVQWFRFSHGIFPPLLSYVYKDRSVVSCYASVHLAAPCVCVSPSSCSSWTLLPCIPRVACLSSSHFLPSSTNLSDELLPVITQVTKFPCDFSFAYYGAVVSPVDALISRFFSSTRVAIVSRDVTFGFRVVDFICL